MAGAAARLSRGALPAALAAALLLTGARPAAAAPAVDVAGSWVVTAKGPGESTYEETYEMTKAGVVIGSGPAGPVHGSVSGYSFAYTYETAGGGEETHVKATIAPDGSSYAGTFEASGGASGTIEAHRAGGGGGSGGSGGGPGGAAPRATALSISCALGAGGREGTCTASVRDASGAGPPQSPGGIVAFSLATGGEGSFPGASECAPAPAEAGASACAVPFRRGRIAIAPGEQPRVRASFGGSASFQASIGEPSDLSAVDVKALGEREAAGCTLLLTAACRALPSAGGPLVRLLSPSPRALEASLNFAARVPRMVPLKLLCRAALRRAAAIAGGGRECQLQATLRTGTAALGAMRGRALPLDRAMWRAEVEHARVAAIADLLETCTAHVGGAETHCAYLKALVEAAAGALGAPYETLAGAPGGTGAAPIGESSEAAICVAYRSTVYAECVATLEAMAARMGRDLARLRSERRRLGLDAPRPPASARGASALRSVLLGSGTLRVQLGHAGRLHLELPAQARRLLQAARAGHSATLPVTLTVSAYRFGGELTTRTSRLRLRLR